MVNFFSKYIWVIAIVLVMMGSMGGYGQLQAFKLDNKYRNEGGTATITSITNINARDSKGPWKGSDKVHRNINADVRYTTAAGEPVLLTQRWMEPKLANKIAAGDAIQIEYLIGDPATIRPVGNGFHVVMLLLYVLIMGAGLLLMKRLLRSDR